MVRDTGARQQHDTRRHTHAGTQHTFRTPSLVAMALQWREIAGSTANGQEEVKRR